MNAPQTPDPERRKNKKGGRPKLAEDKKKNKLIKAYVTAENYAKIHKLSDDIGHSVSYIINEFCTNGKVVAAVPPELFKYFRDVSGLATNVNQIAKTLNFYGKKDIGRAFEILGDELQLMLKEASKHIKKKER